MNWERLTAGDFEKAVDTCGGVCLLPLGVIEKHGDHLPLGQDTFYVHAQCTQAAEREPAMVFPFFFLGKINEARHQPGTIALDFKLLLPVLESICDEIARNGFKKILIVNGHGGNWHMLGYFLESLLEKDKDYMVYVPGAKAWDREKEFMEACCDGHGGESETSRALHFFPELVKSETPAAYGRSLDRLAEFDDLGLQTPMGWYSRHPGHLRGDGTPGSGEKGRRIAELRAERMAEMIRLLKRDNTPFDLYREFRSRTGKPATVER